MDRFRFIDVNQNSDDWYKLRAGKLTSSNLGKIMANYGKAFGEPAKKLAMVIANEIVTGNPVESNYTNEHMQRGHEQEPIARMLYENLTFCDVTNGGFFESEFVGCSPDGLVGDDGVIEIKSVIVPTHFATVKRQGVDPAYKWQCIGNLFFTGREWLDFISYCEDFQEGKNLFVHRILKTDLSEQFEMIEKRVLEFELVVSDFVKTISESKYINY